LKVISSESSPETTSFTIMSHTSALTSFPIPMIPLISSGEIEPPPSSSKSPNAV
jgi:hypothetical protein